MRIETTFAALADPVRMQVIRLLSEKPRRAGELASALDLTPPALSRHLRILRRGGLVSEHGVEDDARVRIYELQPEAFDQASTWLTEVGQYWDGQLKAFQAHVRKKRRQP